MGGTLKPGGSGAPSFTVWAMKEPDGANLDRIQIIKGWVDAKGEPQDRVFDVVWSGDRKPGRGRQAAGGRQHRRRLRRPPTRTRSAAPELMGTWTDTSFDPKQGALYYVRVLLIPTPRWSTYDAVRAGLPLLEDVPATVQERAWTSPIWYKPGR